MGYIRHINTGICSDNNTSVLCGSALTERNYYFNSFEQFHEHVLGNRIHLFGIKEEWKYSLVAIVIACLIS